MICVYGPKVTVALALNGHATKNGEAVCVELTMGTERYVHTYIRRHCSMRMHMNMNTYIYLVSVITFSKLFTAS